MAEKSLKKNAVLNIIKTLMGIIFPIITFPYASRILLPEGIGKVNFANSIIGYFSLLASLGIGTYATREAAKIRDDKLLLKKFVKEILFINFISTLISYILFFMVLFFVPKLFDYRKLLLICSLTILFNTLGINWFYSAIEEYTYITTRTIFFQIINIFFLFIFVKTKEDIYLYALMNVIASVGSSLLNFIHLHKFLSFKGKDKLEIKKHIKPIFVLFGMAVVTSIYTLLDTTMIGFLAGDEQVGFYTAATKINKMVLLVVTSCSTVLFPRLSYYIEKKDKEEFLKLLQRGFSITLCLAIPCTIGLNLLSSQITIIFSGENYTPAIPVMKIMNPIIIIIAISNYIGIQCLIPLNKEKFTLYSVILGAICNFTLNLILIPKYKALGAGIATVCAETAVSLFQIIVSRKDLSLRFLLKDIYQFIIAAIAMGFSVFAICNIISSIYIQVILSITTGILIYFFMLLILKNNIIKDLINSILHKKKEL